MQPFGSTRRAYQNSGMDIPRLSFSSGTQKYTPSGRASAMAFSGGAKADEATHQRAFAARPTPMSSAMTGSTPAQPRHFTGKQSIPLKKTIALATLPTHDSSAYLMNTLPLRSDIDWLASSRRSCTMTKTKPQPKPEKSESRKRNGSPSKKASSTTLSKSKRRKKDPQSTAAEESQQFDIEAILDKKKDEHDVWQYLVKWIGYPESENCWITKRAFADRSPGSLFYEYEQKWAKAREEEREKAAMKVASAGGSVVIDETASGSEYVDTARGDGHASCSVAVAEGSENAEKSAQEATGPSNTVASTTFELLRKSPIPPIMPASSSGDTTMPPYTSFDDRHPNRRGSPKRKNELPSRRAEARRRIGSAAAKPSTLSSSGTSTTTNGMSGSEQPNSNDNYHNLSQSENAAGMDSQLSSAVSTSTATATDEQQLASDDTVFWGNSVSASSESNGMNALAAAAEATAAARISDEVDAVVVADAVQPAVVSAAAEGDIVEDHAFSSPSDSTMNDSSSKTESGNANGWSLLEVVRPLISDGTDDGGANRSAFNGMQNAPKSFDLDTAEMPTETARAPAVADSPAANLDVFAEAAVAAAVDHGAQKDADSDATLNDRQQQSNQQELFQSHFSNISSPDRRTSRSPSSKRTSRSPNRSFAPAEISAVKSPSTPVPTLAAAVTVAEPSSSSPPTAKGAGETENRQRKPGLRRMQTRKRTITDDDTSGDRSSVMRNGRRSRNAGGGNKYMAAAASTPVEPAVIPPTRVSARQQQRLVSNKQTSPSVTDNSSSSGENSSSQQNEGRVERGAAAVATRKSIADGGLRMPSFGRDAVRSESRNTTGSSTHFIHFNHKFENRQLAPAAAGGRQKSASRPSPSGAHIEVLRKVAEAAETCFRLLCRARDDDRTELVTGLSGDLRMSMRAVMGTLVHPIDSLLAKYSMPPPADDEGAARAVGRRRQLPVLDDCDRFQYDSHEAVLMSLDEMSAMLSLIKSICVELMKFTVVIPRVSISHLLVLVNGVVNILCDRT